MTEETITSETQPPDVQPPELPRRRSPLRRLGCGLMLVIWFAILLLPCALVVIAVRQEIVISQGDAPGQQTRFWLISEADQRGFGLSTASVMQISENALCVQTNVHFYLWTGSADPLTYCECYERVNADAPWSLTSTSDGVCSG